MVLGSFCGISLAVASSPPHYRNFIVLLKSIKGKEWKGFI
jgi:hypothetical protein